TGSYLFPLVNKRPKKETQGVMIGSRILVYRVRMKTNTASGLIALSMENPALEFEEFRWRGEAVPDANTAVSARLSRRYGSRTVADSRLLLERLQKPRNLSRRVQRGYVADADCRESRSQSGADAPLSVLEKGGAHQ